MTSTPRERLAALLERAIGVDGAAGGSYVQFADYLLSHGWIESGHAGEALPEQRKNEAESLAPPDASPAPSLEACPRCGLAGHWQHDTGKASCVKCGYDPAPVEVREPLSAPLPSELLGLIEALADAERLNGQMLGNDHAIDAARTDLIAGIQRYREEGQEEVQKLNSRIEELEAELVRAAINVQEWSKIAGSWRERMFRTERMFFIYRLELIKCNNSLRHKNIKIKNLQEQVRGLKELDKTLRVWCARCSGTGWVEGGTAIKTPCPDCSQ